MTLLLQIIAALLPVVVLMIIIYLKDAYQPEPIVKLLLATLFGVFSALLSFTMSIPLSFIHEVLIGEIGPFYNAFFIAAIPEEVAKLACLWVFLRFNRDYDEYVDGIVYAACVGFGFAGFENILYVIRSGAEWGFVAYIRAFMSVPGHMFFAIIMGYCFSLAWFAKRWKYAVLAIVLPVLAHGLYDYILMFSSWLNAPVVVFLWGYPAVIGLLIFLYKKCLRMIDSHLRKDLGDMAYTIEAAHTADFYVPEEREYYDKNEK